MRQPKLTAQYIYDTMVQLNENVFTAEKALGDAHESLGPDSSAYSIIEKAYNTAQRELHNFSIKTYKEY
jgi:hypothetical protein